MERNRLFFANSLVKIVAFENLLDRCFRTKFYKISGCEFVHPLAVKTQLGFLRVEQFEHLAFVGLGVSVDLLT